MKLKSFSKHFGDLNSLMKMHTMMKRLNVTHQLGTIGMEVNKSDKFVGITMLWFYTDEPANGILEPHTNYTTHLRYWRYRQHRRRKNYWMRLRPLHLHIWCRAYCHHYPAASDPNRSHWCRTTLPDPAKINGIPKLWESTASGREMNSSFLIKINIKLWHIVVRFEVEYWINLSLAVSLKSNSKTAFCRLD